MFEQLCDIYVNSSKCDPPLSVDVSNINATIMKEEKVKIKKFNCHSVQNN